MASAAASAAAAVAVSAAACSAACSAAAVVAVSPAPCSAARSVAAVVVAAVVPALAAAVAAYGVHPALAAAAVAAYGVPPAVADVLAVLGGVLGAADLHPSPYHRRRLRRQNDRFYFYSLSRPQVFLLPLFPPVPSLPPSAPRLWRPRSELPSATTAHGRYGSFGGSFSVATRISFAGEGTQHGRALEYRSICRQQKQP